MTILESVISPDKFFSIDGLDYEKGMYSVYYLNKELDSNGDIIQDNVKVGLRNKSDFSQVLVYPIPINSWNDGAFNTLGDLLSFLIPLIGFNNGGVVGSDFIISQRVDTYSELLDGETIGELSYVENSQGTPWLPNTLGGTYYPAGWYVWDGTNWVSDRNAIVNQLEQHITDVYTKTESDSRYVNVTGDTMTGDLTASNFIGNGSGLTDVDAVTLGGQPASYYNFRNYGLGSNAIPISDFDAVTETGFYYNPSSSTNGAPNNVASLNLIHININSNSATQIVNRTGASQQWYRRKSGGVWQPWVELWHSGNFTPSDYLNKTTGGTITGKVTVTSLNTTPITFANLPASPSIGDIATITDASSVTYRGVASGGGSDVALVMYDGTNWIYH